MSLMRRHDRPMSIDWNSIGALVRKTRKARRPKMTQGDLAEAVGVEQQTISRIERGAPSSLTTLAAICGVLELELELDVRVPDLTTMRYEGPVELVRTIHALGDLPPEQRSPLVSLLEVFPQLPESVQEGVLMQVDYWIRRYGSIDSESKATA